jgi:hypothetical protein
MRAAVTDPSVSRASVERTAFCFVLGAALGTALDALHAYGDVETYANPVIGRLGWFVPLEFGLVGVVAGLVVPALDERLVGRRLAWSLGVRLREAALILLLYAATIAGNGWGAPLLLVAFTVLVVVRVARGGTRGDWLFAVVAAVAGPAVEASIVALGVFDYTEPDLLGLPMWLPALWANGGLVVRRLFA